MCLSYLSILYSHTQSFNAKQLTDYVKLPGGSYTYGVLTDNWINKDLFVWKLVNNNILDKECFKQTDSQADEKIGNGTALFASTQYGCVVNSTKLTGLYTSLPEMRYVPVGPLNYSDGSAATQGKTYGRSGSPVIFFPTSHTDAVAMFLRVRLPEEPREVRAESGGVPVAARCEWDGRSRTLLVRCDSRGERVTIGGALKS